MSCEVKKKYTPDEYGKVAIKAKRLLRSSNGEQELQYWLSRNYIAEDAQALYDAITTKSFNRSYGENTQNKEESLIKNDASSVEVERTPEEDPSDSYYFDTADEIPASFFTRHTNDNEYKLLVKEFNERLIKDLVYDSSTGIGVGDANSPTPFGSTLVNERLREYRNELISKLEKVVGRVDVSDEKDPIQYRSKINRLLRKFNKAYQIDKIRNNGEGIPKDTYRAYVALAMFDKLISDLGIVKLNPGYSADDMYIDNNRYVYAGQKVKYDQRFGQETANIDDYTSPLVKILLNTITGLDRQGNSTGSAITLDGFKHAVRELMGWCWLNTDTININGAKINPYKEVLKGEKADWNNLILLYINRNYLKGTPLSKVGTILNGMRVQIFEKMPTELRNLFVSQIANTVHSSYLEYITDWNKDHTEIKTILAEDRLLDRSEIILKKRLSYKINYYQQLPKEEFESRLKDLGIEIKSSGDGIDIKIPYGNNNYFNVSIVRDGDDFVFARSDGSTNLDTISDDIIANITEQLIDTYIPREVGENGEKKYAYLITNIDDRLPKNLLGVFGKAIAVTCLASHPDTAGQFAFDDTSSENKLLTYRTKLLDNSVREAARFINEIYGYGLSSVVKNLNGDNLPAAQMGSMFYRTPNIIQNVLDVTSVPGQTHALEKNLFVVGNNRTAIANTNIREGIKVNGEVKSIENLNPAEVVQVSIIQDFWNRIDRVDPTNKNSHIVDIQPMTYSDKKRQMTKAIILERLNLSAWGVQQNAFDYIRNLATRFVYSSNGTKLFDEDVIYDVIRKVRASQVQHNAIEILNRFSKAFKFYKQAELRHVNDALDKAKNTVYPNDNRVKELEETIQKLKKDIDTLDKELAVKDITYKAISDRWNLINNELSTYKGKSAIANLMRHAGVDFNEETDVVSAVKDGASNGHILNPSLYYNVQTYLSDDTSNFVKRMRRQKQLFLRDLIDADFTLSVFKDGSLWSVFNKYAAEEAKGGRPDWVDSVSGTILLYKIRNSKGEVQNNIDVHDSTIDFTSGDYIIELNPILNSYFFTQNLLGQQIKALHFGETWNYKGKSDIDLSHYDYEADESSRFIAQTKRAVVGGGTVKLFIKDRAYGVANKWRMASWRDVEAPVNDLNGDEHDEKVADGAVYMAPEQAIMENWSLQDSSVGDNFKKSLYGEIDNSGSLNEIKTAAFTMSNYNRKHNPYSKKINMERMFRLTHSDVFDNVIDFSRYYNPAEGANIYSSSKPGENSRKITEHDYIYFWDVESGKYYRINNLIQNGNRVSRVLQEVNRKGKEVGKEFVEAEKTINSFYAIDQMLGGAYCMEYDANSARIKTSDKNNRISAVIMAEEDLKDKIIHYVVSTSAFKVGMKNVNDSDVFSTTSTVDKLWEFSFDPSYSGVQMDAKHDVEDGHVTEMSQMVQSLIQDGYLVDIVQEIYGFIADVTKSGRSDFESTDRESVSKAISKALIKSLQSGSGNIVTLADTFVKQVQSDYLRYGTELKLPFSVANLRSKFISVVTSALSKNSLRRSYPGLGTVQAPGYGFMQYINLPMNNAIGKYNLTFEEAANQLRNLAHEKGKTIEDCFIDKEATTDGYLTDNYINTWQNTPVLEVITPKEIDFEDTIVYRGNDNWIVKKIESGSDRDYYRNLYNWDGIIYRWNTQGRDLLPSITRVTVNDNVYSLWDFDAERACFYINELIKANKDRAKGKAIKVLGYAEKAEFVQMLHPGINIDNNKELEAALKEEKANARTIFLEYSEALKNGQSFRTSQYAFDSQETRAILRSLQSIPEEEILSYINELLLSEPSVDKLYAIAKFAKMQAEPIRNEIYRMFPDIQSIDTEYDLGQPEVSFAQVIMGRIHGSKFNLPSGTNVAEILSRGENYFVRSIDNQVKHLTSRTGRQLYDIALHTSNGDSFYILVGNSEANNAKWRQVDQISKKFKSLDGDLFYNGDKLCSAYGIQFGTYLDESGIERNMLYVKDNATLEKFKRSGDFIFERYNYQNSNWRNVIQQQYGFAFNNGKLTKNLYLGNIILRKGSDINNIDLPNVVQILRDLESEKTHKKIWELSKQKFDAFKKSLLYIGARIPSQSMQSYSGAEIINFTDSNENEIYLPRTLTWVAGSDYDIDKWYIMGWSITDTGTIPSFKSLLGFSDDDVQTLPAPTGQNIDYEISTQPVLSNNIVNITEDELKAAKLGNIAPIRKVLMSGATTINFVIPDDFAGNDFNAFFEVAGDLNDSFNDAQDFVNTINTWNKRSKKSDEVVRSYSDAIFKNNVVRALQEALRDPSVQINLLTSLNMDTAKSVAKANVAASNRDKTMSPDNPMSIFNQQYANMVGRSGIGGVAIAQKAFNTMSFALNLGVTQWSHKLLSSQNLQEDLRSLTDYLSVITFEGKLQDKSIRTLANLNLRPLIRALTNIGISSFNYGDGLSEELQSFINPENGEFNLLDYVNTLQHNSNINNATDLFSNLMSAATDNAKELLLDKLNAIGDFIDVYCYLFATGESFEDIGKFTTSSVFNTVLRYSRGNIFEIGNNRPGFKNAIDFVRDQRDLGLVNPNLYRASLANRDYLRIVLTDKDLEKIIEENNITYANALNLNKPINANDLRQILFNPRTRVDHYANNIENFCYSPVFNDILSTKVRSLFRRDDSYALSYLKWLGPIAYNAKPQESVYNFDYNGDDVDYNYDDIIAEDVTAKYNTVNDDISKNSKAALVSIYRYVQEYIIPKNRRLRTATALGENIDVILDKLVSIHDGSSEMSILGQMLSINQGMKANDYNEYNFIARINSSINRRYWDKYQQDRRTNSDLENNYEAFDLVKFVRDSEYRENQINQYNNVKNTFNVLDVVAKSPHFMEMYDTAVLNREIITDNSTAVRLTRKLATQIFDVLYGEGNQNKVHQGLLYNLSKDELNNLSRYVDDLITYHFLINTGEILAFENLDKLNFKDYVRSNTGSIRTSRTVTTSFDLTTPEGIASFKKLMDTVVIPGLKADPKFGSNMFIRMLAIDGVKDQKTGIIKRYYKVSTDNSAMNPMSKAYQLYSEARDAFYDIANKAIPTDILPTNNGNKSWSIMDLFYLYNLIVSKEGFNNTGFSTIFDDVINQGLKTNLVNAYLKYIADLDHGDIKVAEGKNTQDTIGYNIIDAIASIITPKNAYKLKASVNSRGFSLRTNGGNEELSVDLTLNPNPSDFTFNFPSIYQSNSFVPKWEGYKPQINIQMPYTPTSEAVVKEAVRYMQELWGEDIPIKVINNADLDRWENRGVLMFEGNPTDGQKAIIRSSLGFIHNGIIYLNPDVEGFGTNTPVHELTHVIAANLKFNPKYRALYYELLNTVWQEKERNNEVESLKKRYPNRKASDLKEEALAEFIGDMFSKNFTDMFGSRVIFSYELSNAVREVLDSIFNANFNEEQFNLGRLGETPIEDVFKIINTGWFDFNTHNATRLNIILSQKLASVKNEIVDYKCIEI